MPSARVIPYYTYSDYLQWEGRWELIDGMPYAMSPAPAPFHQYVSSQIQHEFIKALGAKGCKKCKVYDFLDVKINEDTIIQPDVLILCKPIIKKFLDFPATLVVEILSPSTALKDRNNKYTIYEKFGVKYYLIVDPDHQKIEIYVLNQEGIYELSPVNSLDDIPFDLEDCEISVNLSEIFT